MTARQWKNKLVDELETEEANVNFLNYTVFKNVPDILRPTQEDEGKRLWLADEYKTLKVKLKKYKGDTLDITYAGEKKYRSIFKEEAVLHPDLITEKRLKEYGYEIKDGRSTNK